MTEALLSDLNYRYRGHSANLKGREEANLISLAIRAFKLVLARGVVNSDTGPVWPDLGG